MICPYCGTGVNIDFREHNFPVPTEKDEYEEVYGNLSGFCPECNNFIILVQYGTYENQVYDNVYIDKVEFQEQVYPKFLFKKTLNKYIPEKYSKLFREAEAVLELSPRASATLSRYLLQIIIREELKIKKKNLEEEISALENQASIPSTLITMLQVLRRIANFGAHPKKSTNTNEIVDVESGEANIMLDIINELFDFVFIKPQKQKEFLKLIEDKYNISIDNLKSS